MLTEIVLLSIGERGPTRLAAGRPIRRAGLLGRCICMRGPAAGRSVDKVDLFPLPWTLLTGNRHVRWIAGSCCHCHYTLFLPNYKLFLDILED